MVKVQFLPMQSISWDLLILVQEFVNLAYSKRHLVSLEDQAQPDSIRTVMSLCPLIATQEAK